MRVDRRDLITRKALRPPAKPPGELAAGENCDVTCGLLLDGEAARCAVDGEQPGDEHGEAHRVS